MADFITLVTGKSDPSFSVQECRNYGLNLLFSDTSVTFTILDLRISRYLMVQQVRKNDLAARHTPGYVPGFSDFLKGVAGTFPWLKSPFRSVRIAYEGQKVTLIPTPLFDGDMLLHYLDLNFSMPAGELAFADLLTRFDTQLVYAMPHEVHESVKELFPAAKMVHHGSVFMNSVWLIARLRSGTPRTYINLRDKAFDLMVYDGRQLHYFNTFTFITPEDVVYFVLFVMEQLELNPEKIQAILLGSIERSSNLYELLYRYVKHVEFGRRNEAFKYSPELSELPPHSYYTLFNFQACGL